MIVEHNHIIVPHFNKDDERRLDLHDFNTIPGEGHNKEITDEEIEKMNSDWQKKQKEKQEENTKNNEPEIDETDAYFGPEDLAEDMHLKAQYDEDIEHAYIAKRFFTTGAYSLEAGTEVLHGEESIATVKEFCAKHKNFAIAMDTQNVLFIFSKAPTRLPFNTILPNKKEDITNPDKPYGSDAFILTQITESNILIIC